MSYKPELNIKAVGTNKTRKKKLIRRATPLKRVSNNTDCILNSSNLLQELGIRKIKTRKSSRNNSVDMKKTNKPKTHK
jgi:hypothetical protein